MTQQDARSYDDILDYNWTRDSLPNRMPLSQRATVEWSMNIRSPSFYCESPLSVLSLRRVSANTLFTLFDAIVVDPEMSDCRVPGGTGDRAEYQMESSRIAILHDLFRERKKALCFRRHRQGNPMLSPPSGLRPVFHSRGRVNPFAVPGRTDGHFCVY